MLTRTITLTLACALGAKAADTGGETSWMSGVDGEWMFAPGWSNQVPCGTVTATLPAYEAEYTLSISGEYHPVGVLSLAPGTGIALRPGAILDFGADFSAPCPSEDTTTMTTTSTATSVTATATTTTTTTATATDTATTTTTVSTTTIYDPDAADCIETQDECTVACEKGAARNYVKTADAIKTGRACVGATDCKPSEGGCPAPTTKAPVTKPAAAGGNTDAADADATVKALKTALGGGTEIIVGGASIKIDKSKISAGSDGNTVIIAIAGGEKLTTAEKATIAAQIAAMMSRPSATITVNDDGSITVTLGKVQESGTEDGGGGSMGPIIGAVVVVLLLAGVGFFVYSRKEGGPKPMSFDASELGNERVMENPMYEDPSDPQDASGDVEGNYDELPAGGFQSEPAEKKKSKKAKLTDEEKAAKKAKKAAKAAKAAEEEDFTEGFGDGGEDTAGYMEVGVTDSKTE